MVVKLTPNDWTDIFFPCCRILGLNIIWKTVDLHQRELLTRSMNSLQQLRSTWLLQIFQMYCSRPVYKCSPFLYLYHLVFNKTVICFINLTRVSHYLIVYPGGYLHNKCYKLYRPWRTIWCWGFWFSKWLYKIDEVRFYNFINTNNFIAVGFLLSCHIMMTTANWDAKLENIERRKCLNSSSCKRLF